MNLKKKNISKRQKKYWKRLRQKIPINQSICEQQKGKKETLKAMPILWKNKNLYRFCCTIQKRWHHINTHPPVSPSTQTEITGCFDLQKQKIKMTYKQCFSLKDSTWQRLSAAFDGDRHCQFGDTEIHPRCF